MPKIYFVCVGNTCRSPMAAEVMNQLIALNGRTDFVADSFGVNPFFGDDSDVRGLRETAVAQVMGRVNGLKNHVPKGFSSVRLQPGDRLIILDKGHSAAFFDQFKGNSPSPGAYPIIVMDTEDPFGGTIEDYIDCCTELRDRLKYNFELILGSACS